MKFWIDQSILTDSPTLSLLRKKFNISEQDVKEREGKLTYRGYFYRNYSLMFITIAHTRHTKEQLILLLRAMGFAQEHILLPREERLELVRDAIESCLVSCIPDSFIRSEDCYFLLERIDDELKNCDYI